MVQESFGLEKILCPGKFCVNKRLFPYTFKRHKVVKFARLHISSKAKTPKLNPSVANLSRNWSLFCPKDFILYIIPLMILCTVHLLPPDSLLWLSVSTPAIVRVPYWVNKVRVMLPWFSPKVAVVFSNMQKQSQLLLCPSQVELGVSRQKRVRQHQLKTLDFAIWQVSEDPFHTESVSWGNTLGSNP